MAKFISKYDNLTMVDGKGQLFNFEGGVFDTTDKDKIATIKNSQLYGSYITEAVAQVKSEPVAPDA